MNVIGQIDPSAFARAPRMHHGDDEPALEFPSSASSRARGLLALRAQNWRASGSPTPPGPVWNWIDGQYLTYNGETASDPAWSILDAFLPVTPGGSVTGRWAQTGAYGGRMLHAFTADKVYKDYWTYNMPSGERTISLASYPSYALFRICVLTADKDYAFLRDNVTGEYLYKGALVP